MLIDKVKIILKEIIQENPLQGKFLKDSVDYLTPEETNILNTYIEFLINGGLSINYLAKCYNLIVKDTLREQIYFLKHSKYRYSCFDEVSSSVYYKREYMEMYMYGLALTQFLWPNHLDLYRWYMNNIPKQKKGKYLEIGPGHGLYFVNSMRVSLFDFFEGIDISPTSTELTRSVLESGIFGKLRNFKVYNSNFIDTSFEYKYDAVIMGEVLEHVEQPHRFLEKIKSIINNDAFIYITTVLNAAAVDHIYLFDTLESLEEVIINSGLFIKKKLLVPYNNMSVDESLEKHLPTNVAMVLGDING